MTLKSDLIAEMPNIFTGKEWIVDDATVVPGPTDVLLKSNHAKHFKSATVLYADISESTNMVDKYIWWFSAEVYKAYLRCASEIIKDEAGVITAYDGDRVMAVFLGNNKNTRAVRCAMKINFAVAEIIAPAIKAKFPGEAFVLKHVVGIDTSELRAARVGVHGDNDLVWVGHAANHAAKLCTQKVKMLWITQAVYDQMLDEVKFTNGVNMWSPYTWQGASIHGSDYRWWPA